jgi:hypothetical protein
MARCGLVPLRSVRLCSRCVRCDPFASYLGELFVVLSSDAIAIPVRRGATCQTKSHVRNDKKC